MSTTITPFVLGSGMSGQAMTKALSIIRIIDDEIDLAPTIQLRRDEALASVAGGAEHPLLLIGNPHGRHANTLLDGIAAGFEYFVVDKPVCVRVDDIARLAEVSQDVAVLHGFRQQWGPQAIKAMLDAGEFGELISMEGRYWQSSAAQSAIDRAGGHSGTSKDWKNDPALNGPFDTFIDLGAHFVDLMLHLAGDVPTSARAWVSHVNAPASHRDTHAHIDLVFPAFRARGSISKTAHGSGNLLEFTVLGAQQAAMWSVEHPDELRVARGGTTRIVQRSANDFGSGQPPFHGAGWLEGYIEIIHNYLRTATGRPGGGYPTLPESLRVMDILLRIDTSA